MRINGNHRGAKTARQDHPAAFRRLRAGGSVGQFASSEGHRVDGQSGTFRAAVFGVNDGLVSNLSLVMGVAGAFSMAAGEYVSMRAQREMFENQIEIERRELAEDPRGEQKELELIYRSKGLPNAAAAELASKMMRDPDVALDTHAKEELGLNMKELGSPWGAAASSFVAFVVGAIVPVLPYILFASGTAFMTSLIFSAFALLAVGAMIASHTGRSTFVSALRMLLIGFGAAAVTYLVGSVIGVSTGL